MPTEAEVRETIIARLATLTITTGDPPQSVTLAESRVAPDLLGYDPSSVAHGCFSVDCSNAQPQGRQRGKTMVRSTVVVRFTWRLTAAPQGASITSALNAEAQMIEHLRANSDWITWDSPFQLVWQRSLRETVSPEWRRVTITFESIFYFDLEST